MTTNSPFPDKTNKPEVIGRVVPRYSKAPPIRRSPFSWVTGTLHTSKRRLRLLAQVAIKRPRYSALGVVLLVAVASVYFFWGNRSDSATPLPAGEDTAYKSDGLTKGTPKFETILPAGTTIDSFGGWTRVSPKDRDPVYAYADVVGKVPINVSQQPLPKEFKVDTDKQIKLLAESYTANEKLTLDDMTVYIGTSAKGPQSAIFTKNDLLILIKASTELSSKQWTNYIRALE